MKTHTINWKGKKKTLNINITNDKKKKKRMEFKIWEIKYKAEKKYYL